MDASKDGGIIKMSSRDSDSVTIEIDYNFASENVDESPHEDSVRNRQTDKIENKNKNESIQSKKTEVYKILKMFEFTSERKMMSIIV